MLLNHQKEAKSDQWELIEFPAIMPSGKPVWPEYWNFKELETVKASISVSKFGVIKFGENRNHGFSNW